MNVVVYGLYHLGCVTAACLAEQGFSVIGLVDKQEEVSLLEMSHLPIYEPGLQELFQSVISKQKLNFTIDRSCLKNCNRASNEPKVEA